MAASVSGSVKSHNHVETVTDWEDEADGLEVEARSSPNRAPSIRQAAAFLRSSFNASTRFLRLSSVTERPTVKPVGHGKGSSQEPSGTFVGTLLTGLANAVGLGRDISPNRDASPPDISTRGKLMTSQTRALARLSSAAMMRAELQNYSQFGDLRNDSFTSPTAAKLLRRSSLLHRAVEGGSTGPAAGLPSRSGTLHRHSSPGPMRNSTSLSRVSAPGYSATEAAAMLSGGSIASPRDVKAALWGPSQPMPPRKAPSCQETELTAVEAAGSPAPRCPQACTMPRIPSPMHPLPHPPAHPRYDSVDSGVSPAGSRPSSAERLPPMQRQGSSVRDRPPTPHGRTSNNGGSPPSKISKVLGSFRLPEILTGASAPDKSGRFAAERRGSVTGALTGIMSSFSRPSLIACDSSTRSHRASASGSGGNMVGGTLIRPSGGSFLAPGGSPVVGPGGAAISASVAKRAAAATAVVPSPVSVSAIAAAAVAAAAPHVLTSGASGSPLLRPSGVSVTSRVDSGTGKPAGGILQSFQSSLQQEEEGALAAVDAEFDRRFGCTPPIAVPGVVDAVALSRQLRELQGQGNSLSQSPRPPSAERSVPPPGLWRRSMFSNGNSQGVAANGTAGSPDTQPHAHQRHHRNSCSAALMTSGGDGGGPESVLISSFDASSSPPPSLNPKMRLASIRLSYAEGIVGGNAACARGQPDDGAPCSPGISAPQPPVAGVPLGVSPRRRSCEMYERPAMAT